MLGVLEPDEIERVLRSQHLGRLGIYGDGRVYVVPISYGYDGACVYAHSHEGLKLQLMRAHPEVCFEVEEVESPARWRTVISHGAFEELTDPVERDTALATIVAQGGKAYPPSMAPYVNGPDRIAVYRIRLTEKTGRYERDEVFPQHMRAT